MLLRNQSVNIGILIAFGMDLTRPILSTPHPTLC
jgi:hypothetical protein